MITKFGTGIDLDHILDELDDEGHRSKVKVTRSKKRDFQDFFLLSEQILNPGIWCDVM